MTVCECTRCDDPATHVVKDDPTGVEAVCEDHAIAADHMGYTVRERVER